ncbi:unnamed protein product [Arabis nemorensis]|uniref:Uncharacterized protein n=1 Tax=Arabis nemorensis TaxID=586526 RepID=A0A565AJQ8_9BRAS|nr:unnamed protein product [Arabis nemorensis]
MEKESMTATIASSGSLPPGSSETTAIPLGSSEISPPPSENTRNTTPQVSGSLPSETTAISPPPSENTRNTTPQVPGSLPPGSSQISPAAPPGGDRDPPATPLLEPPSRDERRMRQWAKMVKRCHEVIALLIGFVLVFAPEGFVIKGMHANDGQVNPVAIIVNILDNLQTHLVFPFIIAGLSYALFYVLSSSSMPVAWLLWMDALSVIAGFSVVFLVIFYISQRMFIVGGTVGALVLGILFCCQFPRKLIVPRDIQVGA